MSKQELVIPQKLREQKRWVPSKDKVPTVKWSDQGSWCRFDDLPARHDPSFVLTDGNILALDIDDVRDPSTGELNSKVEDALKNELPPTYVEISASGTGLHAFFEGAKPDIFNRSMLKDAFGSGTSLEVYDGSDTKLITVTGDVWNGCHEIAAVDARVDAFLVDKARARLKTELKKRAAGSRNTTNPQPGPKLSDQQVTQKLFAAKNAKDNKKLWEEPGADGNSEGDLALANAIAFYTQDSEQIESVMRESKRVRDKWDEKRGNGTWISETIEKALSGLTATYQPSGSFRHTDTGNAKRLADFLKDETGRSLYRHHPAKAGHFYNAIRGVYAPDDGDKWARQKAQEMVQETIRNTNDSLSQEEEKENPDKTAIKNLKQTLNWAKKCENLGPLTRMIELAHGERGIAAEIDEFDPLVTKNGVRPLACRDGIIDLATGKIVTGQKELLLTNFVDVEYPSTPPNYECVYDTFKEWGFGGEMTDFFGELIARVLLGDTSDHVFAILVGSGRNGKTTFTTQLRRILGTAARAANMSAFLDHGGSSRLNEYADLHCARLAIASEVPTGKFFNTSVVKSLTGGNTVKGCLKFKNHFEYEPRFLLFFEVNELPGVRDFDTALEERVLPIRFEKRFTRDCGTLKTDFGKKLEADAPIWLHWAVEHARRRVETGFPALVIPDKIIKERHRYKADSASQESEFIELALEKSDAMESDTLMQRVIFGKLCEWSKRHGFRKPVSNQFGKFLDEAGFKRTDRSPVKVLGCKWSEKYREAEERRDGGDDGERRDGGDDGEWLTDSPPM